MAGKWIDAGKGLALVSGMVAASIGAPAAWGKDGDAAAWTLQQAIGDPDNLKVSGSARIRYEALDNQFRPGLKDSDSIVLLRTSLTAEYDTGPVRVGAEVMDSRVYSAGPGSSIGTGEVNAVELIQAYVGFDLGKALGSKSETTLDVGRFTMDVGSRRLVARNNFRNTTNAFFGFKAQYNGSGGTYGTAFYTLPLMRLPDDKASLLDNKVERDRQNFDLTFWGVSLGKPVHDGSTVEVYFYGLDENDSPDVATRNRTLYTPGLRLHRKPKRGKFDYEFEGAYQFGHIRASKAASAAKLDVSAYFVHATVGYQFAMPGSPRIAFEYDRASGDGSNGSFGRFDTLYGARRTDFGPTSIYGPLSRANISSAGVRLEVTPEKRWDGLVMYRAAWLESATDSFANTGVRDPSGASGSFAGHQVEARARYWIVPKLLRVDTGAAVLLTSGFLDRAPGANRNGNPLYGYFDLIATF